MGLPCAHRIADLLLEHQPIPLSDIHPFWRIGLGREISQYLPILEPSLPAPISKSTQNNTTNQMKNYRGQGIPRKKAPSIPTIATLAQMETDEIFLARTGHLRSEYWRCRPR